MRAQTPRKVAHSPVSFLEAQKEASILPQEEEKEMEPEKEALTSLPLPFAFQNPRKTLKDLKAQKLLVMPVQKWIRGDSCESAAKLLALFSHPTTPMYGADCGGCGEALPVPVQRCKSVSKLFRKSCLPRRVGRIRTERSKKQRDWFCGCVATTVI